MAATKGVKLSLKFDDSELRERLRIAVMRGEDLSPLFKRTGAWFIKSVNDTFAARGRPQKWDKLSDYTLAMRRWHAKNTSGAPAFTTKVLEWTGALRRQWEYRIRKAMMEVGTAVPYADRHQQASTSSWQMAPARWERPMVNVPKRIMIQWLPSDFEAVDGLTQGWLEELGLS